jgi:hypothetical protein
VRNNRSLVVEEILSMGWQHRTRKFGFCLLQAVSVTALVHCGSDAPASQNPALSNPSGLAGGTGSAPVLNTPPVLGGVAGASAPVLGNPGPVVTGTAGGASAAAGGGAPAVTEGAQVLPCAVTKALAGNCQSCHGATPIGGAPMSLVTYADFHKAAVTKPTLKVFELARMRLNDSMKPMPPGGAIVATDKSMLDTWLGAGALASTDPADKTCTPVTVTVTGGGTADGSTGAVTAGPGETCYEFKTHQSTTAVDATAYSVSTGEHYEQFYFKAPWPTGTIATRYGTKLDNVKVLHHWLLFSTTETDAEGSHKTSPLPTLLGVNAQLLAGWAVGGTNLAMPDDVGFELPAQGSELNVQWHFYNSTGTVATDQSSVQVCTLPPGSRPHTATITWLGQEDLGGNKWFGGKGMPAHQMSTYSGTCTPSRTGMNATDPINIIAFWPHMHQLGINMKSVINHKGGMAETVFDKPFDFNHQVHYPQQLKLMPGDTITSTCTFNNTTDKGVPFGESSDTEMCYQFTFAWPAHSLENHAASLIGASNTCW